jgi:hypothetical protein
MFVVLAKLHSARQDRIFGPAGSPGNRTIQQNKFAIFASGVRYSCKCRHLMIGIFSTSTQPRAVTRLLSSS